MMTDPRPLLLRTALAALTLAALLVCPWGLAQPPADGQQAVVEIVRLQHREPESIRAAITPVLDERGAISQIDNNLIISTSRANLQQLQALIDTLDVPRRQLRLSVDFSYGSPVTQSPGDTSTFSTVQTTQGVDNPLQNIVMTEGEHAYFSRDNTTAQISPVFGPHGLLLQQDSLRSGQSLSVSAQVRGERVALNIAATRETVALDGSRRNEVVETALEIGFNGWYVIFDDQAQTPAPDSQITSTARSSAIAVRVELLP
jgi:hypothetical protein